MLHSIGTKGLHGLKKVSAPMLNQSIRFGQALAAWNCGFSGARGVMYALDKKDFIAGFQNALEGKPLQKPIVDEIDMNLQTLDSLCPNCTFVQ